MIDGHLDKGDQAGAGRYVPMIADPLSFVKIFSEKRFEGLRPAARDWAGTRLEKQWPIYLDQRRASWQRSGSPEAAADYAAALATAGHHATLVKIFLPIFDRKLDPHEDELWVFVVAPLANALAIEGRWDEAFALFDRASKTWPASWGANAINIDGVRARYRLTKGDFTMSVAMFDEVLEQAN